MLWSIGRCVPDCCGASLRDAEAREPNRPNCEGQHQCDFCDRWVRLCSRAWHLEGCTCAMPWHPLSKTVEQAASTGRVVEAEMTGKDGVRRRHRVKVHGPPKYRRTQVAADDWVTDEYWRCVSEEDGTPADVLTPHIHAE